MGEENPFPISLPFFWGGIDPDEKELLHPKNALPGKNAGEGRKSEGLLRFYCKYEKL
jgi:hypothetical protein